MIPYWTLRTRAFSINERHFKGIRDQWELLTRKNLTRGVVTADDLKRRKTILQFTNAHLQEYECRGYVKTSLGPKFREVIWKLFRKTRRPHEVELSLLRHWERYYNGWEVIVWSQTPQRFLDLETAACCSERTDGERTERMARSTGCLHFTSPRSKEI